MIVHKTHENKVRQRFAKINPSLVFEYKKYLGKY